jgi:hypothetical protein
MSDIYLHLGREPYFENITFKAGLKSTEDFQYIDDSNGLKLKSYKNSKLEVA